MSCSMSISYIHLNDVCFLECHVCSSKSIGLVSFTLLNILSLYVDKYSPRNKSLRLHISKGKLRKTLP